MKILLFEILFQFKLCSMLQRSLTQTWWSFFKNSLIFFISICKGNFFALMFKLLTKLPQPITICCNGIEWWRIVVNLTFCVVVSFHKTTTLKSAIHEKVFPAEHPPTGKLEILRSIQKGSLLYCQSLILMPK